MTDTAHQFCKIFVQATDIQSVAEKLALLLEAKLQRRTLFLPEAVVEVRGNPDLGLAEDFIGWPVTIEIEAGQEATNEAVASLAARIVAASWGDGTAAVAACDYESELPWGGGIERLREHPGTAH